MNKYKVSIFLLIFILLFTILPNTTYANSKTTIPEDSELNWYFVNRGKDTTPEAPKESADFFSKYDAYYVGKQKKKSFI